MALSKEQKADKILDERITTLGAMASGLKVEIQAVSVLVLVHAAKFGTFGRASQLIEALGDGVRRDSLVTWFERFGGMTFDKKDKKFTACKGKAYIAEHLEQAKAKDWTTCKKDPVYAGFSIADGLEKLMKQMSNAQKTAASNPDKAELISTKLDKEHEPLLQRFLKMLDYDMVIEEASSK